MNYWPPRLALQRLYRDYLTSQAQLIELADLQQSAIVFSPHQDDETLGCGGTIIQKIKAGADVKVIFMTDGCRSHTLLPAQELKTIRAQEAVEACQTLGVARSNIFFLEFEDATLTNSYKIAIPVVTELLNCHQPEQVFIPYQKDFLDDHIATHHIVLAALKQTSYPATVYEYAIWFWRHWPWVSVSGDYWNRRAVIKNTILTGFGLLPLRDFQCFLPIENVLPQKQEALAKHRSQMTEFLPDSGWSTLADIANGEFLACQLQNQEFFHRYSLNFPLSNRVV